MYMYVCQVSEECFRLVTPQTMLSTDFHKKTSKAIERTNL